MHSSEIIAYLEAYHQEVTGSSFLLTIKMPDKTIKHLLIDCGLFQESNYSRLNYAIEINPEKIDAIIITHNHADHVGGVPKLVKKGYNKPIYSSHHTKELMGPYLSDSANHQLTNLQEMRKLYPGEKFSIPYGVEKKKKTMNLVQSKDYYKTFEVEKGIKVTLFPNGHLIGAALVLVQISHYGAKDINLLFTGDYKKDNDFFKVPNLPQWVTELPITVVTESTYGDTEKKDRKIVFNNNIKEAIENDQDILIGCFAQGRMQEVLYRIKFLQEVSIIPSYYQIYVDGALAIETCFIYRRFIASSYVHYDSIFDPDVTFLPRNLHFVTPEERKCIFDDKKQKIIVSTSGMLTHGPALTYVPMFLERDTLIHLTGYAASDTLARKLIDAYENNLDEIEIGYSKLKTNATVKWTDEFSSHASASELISFLKQFKNLKFVVINHGESEIKERFKKRVEKEIRAKNINVIDRSNVFVIGAYGLKKSMSSKKETIIIGHGKNDKKKYQNCPNKRYTAMRK